MIGIKKILRNDNGYVLITSLLMLTTLMIIGIAATNTTTFELQISANDKAAKQNFYEAEATAYEGGIVIKKIKLDIESGNLPTFMARSTTDRQTTYSSYRSNQRDELDASIRAPSSWIEEGETNENSFDGTIPGTSFRALDLGISQGSSLSLNSKLGVKHKSAVVGRYSNNSSGRRGDAMVEIGVRF